MTRITQPAEESVSLYKTAWTVLKSVEARQVAHSQFSVNFRSTCDKGNMAMSASPARLCFPPFVLDLATGTLENGSHSARLKPQATAVLCYLVEHAGQVVRQDELLAALWPDVRVGAGMLKTL